MRHSQVYNPGGLKPQAVALTPGISPGHSTQMSKDKPLNPKNIFSSLVKSQTVEQTPYQMPFGIGIKTTGATNINYQTGAFAQVESNHDVTKTEE